MELNCIKELIPAGWELSIKVNNRNFTVELVDPDGYQVPIPVTISDTLADMVNAAIELAQEYRVVAEYRLKR